MLGVEVMTGLASNCKLFALVDPFVLLELVIVAVASALVFFDVSESTDTGCAGSDTAICGGGDCICFYCCFFCCSLRESEIGAAPCTLDWFCFVVACVLDDGAESVYMLFAFICD